MDRRVRIVKRGGRQGERHKFIGAWIPTHVEDAMIEAIASTDSDKSKFLRQALEEKVNRELATS